VRQSITSRPLNHPSTDAHEGFGRSKSLEYGTTLEMIASHSEDLHGKRLAAGKGSGRQKEFLVTGTKGEKK